MLSQENYAKCFVPVLESWKDNRREEFSQKMQEYLSDAADPYKMSLVFVKLCPDLFKNKGNGMAANVVVELQAFMNTGDNKAKYEEHLTIPLQTEVFQVAIRQKNAGLMKLMIKVYRLIDIKETLLPVLLDLKLANRLKDVCMLATALNLQSRFSTEELIVPLLLQNSLAVADDFLDSSPSHQKEILLITDNLIGNKKTNEELSEMYKTQVYKNVNSRKVLSNLVSRLLKRYNMDSSICPHFVRHRALGGLRYLFYKHYGEKGIQKETFCSLVDDTLRDHPNLSKDLMYLFVEYCDPKSAVPYIKKLQLSEEDLPRWIRDVALQESNVEVSNAQTSDFDSECWNGDCDDEYYALTIPLEKVIVIDTVKEFENMMIQVQMSAVIGIDGEWKPNFGIGVSEQVALLQLATADHVFLVDIVTLQPILGCAHWLEVGKLFENSKITKLGYGLRGDFKALGKLHPEIEKSLTKCKNIIDFDHIKPVLLKNKPDIFAHKSSQHKGLSDLVYRCFGLPLDKRDQFSNWDARPLTKSQKYYAAVDAKCLIDIFSYINQKAHDLGIADWKNVKDKHEMEASRNKKEKRKKTKEDCMPPVIAREEIAASDLRVVCDNMLQGLAKQLRSCGIDAVALDNSDHCDKCIEYFEKEKRFVFTRGVSYNRLRKYIPEEYLYSVRTEGVKYQLPEVIEAFNVKVTQDDVFARCSKCNFNFYLILPRSIIIKLLRNMEDNSMTESASWVACDGGMVNICTGETDTGVKIQLKAISESVTNRVEEFFICGKCGWCYWEGSHHSRILKGRLNNIIKGGDDVVSDNCSTDPQQSTDGNDNGASATL